ncbi:formate dehydrogenase subunit gamma [Paenirhodobacter populi]|uniref:Formate dehydrogenase subunit gamma n=1 Tax=Paenirhodobacter populi TaxID=2306993 RepID=A0A443KAT7_9RHOB|nr:formate dehydrogenase subunit gamma [Sinirhodobacter populi]RWR09384.1 formate dehydrogenase subunit gamma [Sinirhodobacter populi]RWR20785.1 formate dehydrogenase subunit gamma [Sinirhodobacter populi]RWR29753.1 formate dehydrogenase subunit gamma [Sinirhodobacter populi]RWR34136.1 formate dehydrogenase subunit gamma [Sinirhodobacter populi]
MARRKFSAPGDEIETRHPVIVNRYRGFTRVNHWITAACMIVLLLSGFSLFHPDLFFLTKLFGGGQNTRWLHPIVGVVLFFSFVGLFVQMWRLNLPRKEDVEWTANLPELVLKGDESKMPELGKYNAGQKVVFWGMSVMIVVLIVSGVMIWEQFFPKLVPIPVRRIAVAVHAFAAFAVILIFIMHVYAAFWARGTISAMTRGTVTGGWAFKHHRKWLRELAGRSDGGSAK